MFVVPNYIATDIVERLGARNSPTAHFTRRYFRFCVQGTVRTIVTNARGLITPRKSGTHRLSLEIAYTTMARTDGTEGRARVNLWINAKAYRVLYIMPGERSDRMVLPDAVVNYENLIPRTNPLWLQQNMEYVTEFE